MYKSLLENCSSRANARIFSPASIRLTIPSLNARLKTRCDDFGLDIRSPMENCPLFSVSHFWGALQSLWHEENGRLPCQLLAHGGSLYARNLSQLPGIKRRDGGRSTRTRKIRDFCVVPRGRSTDKERPRVTLPSEPDAPLRYYIARRSRSHHALATARPEFRELLTGSSRSPGGCPIGGPVAMDRET